ncbi:PAS domain S-box protein [Thermodesulfobacteriota bacterium]
MRILAEFETLIDTLDSAQIIHTALQFIRGKVSVDRMSIAMLDEKRLGFFVLEEDSSIITKGINKDDFFPLGESVISEVVKGKSPLFRPDIAQWPENYELDRRLMEYGFQSDFLIPLVVDNQCNATLNSASLQVNGLTDEDRNLLLFLAPRLAQALENARLHEELLIRERSYRTLAQGIPGIVFRIIQKEKPVMIFFNDQTEEITGYGEQDFQGGCYCPFETKIHPEDQPLVKRVISQAIAAKKPYSVEYRFMHKDGHAVYLLDSGTPVFDKEGKLLHIDGLILNRTEEHEKEEILHRSEQRFKVLFDKAVSGINIIDMDRKILQVNESMEKMLGYLPGELVGMNVEEISVPEDEQRNLGYFKEMMAGTYDHFRMEKKYYRKDGTLLLGALTVTLIRDHEGQPEFIVGFVEDISERKQMEQEAMRARNLDSLGVLAGGIAHDFNNLLMVIFGNIDLAMDDLKPGDSVYKTLAEAAKSLEKTRRLTNQLLTFAEGGILSKSSISLDTMLKDSCDFIFSGSNIRCDFVKSDDLRQVEIDRDQIEQVIHNLLLNAKEAMPAGGRIRIGMGNISLQKGEIPSVAPGNYVRITVEDEGRGIPRELLPRIFEPYFTTKELSVDKGIGLGLAICHSIVTKHEGHLAVESEPNAGTTIFMYLPIIGKGFQESPPVLSDESVSVKRRILILEDDEPVSKMICKMFDRLGYETIVASEGDEAVRIYSEALLSGEVIHAVILDLTIRGGMGGAETMEKLLEIDPDIKAVVASGYAKNEVLIDFKKYGFKAGIPKPYSMKKIRAVMDDIL